MPADTAAPSWTPVALSADIPPATVAPGLFGDHDLALWRSASGRIAAWFDRCPHRGMRLSHGFVRGEALSCIYHGWSYGASGGCRHIPAHPNLEPPEAIRVPVRGLLGGRNPRLPPLLGRQQVGRSEEWRGDPHRLQTINRHHCGRSVPVPTG